LTSVEQLTKLIARGEELDFIINCGINTAWDWARRKRTAMSKKQRPSIPPYQGGRFKLPRLPLSGEEPIPTSTSLEASPDKGRFGGVCFEEAVAFESAFLPYNINLTTLARENRKNPTKAESKIWNEVLRMRQFADYKFLRQKPIDNYIVDFYCS
jgi:hypothetical protein